MHLVDHHAFKTESVRNTGGREGEGEGKERRDGRMRIKGDRGQERGEGERAREGGLTNVWKLGNPASELPSAERPSFLEPEAC